MPHVYDLISQYTDTQLLQGIFVATQGLFIMKICEWIYHPCKWLYDWFSSMFPTDIDKK